MAAELTGFSAAVLRPWLTEQKIAPGVARALEGLLPLDEAQITPYLVPGGNHTPPYTPAQILRQIETELAETLDTQGLAEPR
jgi:hypothetical protein